MTVKCLDNVGVQFVDMLVGRGVINNVVNLQFGTYQFTPVDDLVSPDVAVSCRLRMDVACARQLCEQLTELLAAIPQQAAPEGERPN